MTRRGQGAKDKIVVSVREREPEPEPEPEPEERDHTRHAPVTSGRLFWFVVSQRPRYVHEDAKAPRIP